MTVLGGPPLSARLAGVALRVPLLRRLMLRRIFAQLDSSYETYEDSDYTEANVRWLAQHSRAFLDRLVAERPAAAAALLRFLWTWVADMRVRTIAQRAGQVSPCTVVIDPTDRCNLRCPGCYAKSEDGGSDMPFDSLCSIIEQVIDMGVTLVTLSGGEPFIRERDDQTITRLARRYHDRGFLVFTNGTLIDEPAARRMGRLGNVFPAISVEGFEHQTDERRGKGISRQNRSARQLLARNQVMTGFSATVTRANAEAICSDDFIDMRLDEGDLFGWFFLFQPIGRQPRPDLLVTAEQRALLRETVTRWRKENRPIFLGDFWNDAHLTAGCIAAGRFYFHIYADGNISPCVFCPVSCGNVLDIIAGRSQFGSLRDLAQNHPTFVAFRRHQQSITDRNRPCLMIDHPHAFREVFAAGQCRPAMNMPQDYTSGRIAAAIDQTAQQWSEKSATMGSLFASE